MTLQADLAIAAQQQAYARSNGDQGQLASWSRRRVALLRLSQPEVGPEGPWEVKGRCERVLGPERAYGLRDRRREERVPARGVEDLVAAIRAPSQPRCTQCLAEGRDRRGRGANVAVRDDLCALHLSRITREQPPG